MGKFNIAALLNEFYKCLSYQIGDAVTALDPTTRLEIVASEEKPRSRMAVAMGVGIGIAAAAFFVKPSPPLSRASLLLTEFCRDEQA